MPIYEYERDEPGRCLMCPGRFEVLQENGDEALTHCPACGLRARRVVSRATFNTRSVPSAEKAAERGFTTWKRSGEGVWEKLAGPGVDLIIGTDEDKAAVKAEKKPGKKLNLDEP